MIRRFAADALEDLAGWLEKQAQRLDPPETVRFDLAPFEPREYDWRKAPEEPPEWKTVQGVPRWRTRACPESNIVEGGEVHACAFRCGDDEQQRYIIHWNTHHREGRS